MKKALIVWGGWDGHQPKEVAQIFANILRDDLKFRVEVEDSLDAFINQDLKSFDLIVPIWTMGEITNEQFQPVDEAVQSGVGLAGCHGGMCDSFRQNTQWQFMTGGQWVAHPGNDEVEYSVRPAKGKKRNPLVKNIDEFQVRSEQYYLHVDPAVQVLAVTEMPTADGPHTGNGKFDMPVVWTKKWGEGRVYYNALGHQADLFDLIPEAREMMKRGFKWAAR